MQDYTEHPLYSEFMSTVISGHTYDTEAGFNKFLEKRNANQNQEQKDIRSVEDRIKDSDPETWYTIIVERIRWHIEHYRVAANWYENGQIVFRTELKTVKYDKREDGFHLIGYDNDGKEYCIGGAVVWSIIGSFMIPEHIACLYKPY